MNEISLYIPAYNAEAHLQDCLRSVTQQTLKPAEIIVVDDGSNDATAQIAKSFPEVRLISHERNLGLAAARNSGVRAAKCPLVASIDADCFAKNDWLEQLNKALLANPALSGVGGKLVERHLDSLADRWRAQHLKQDRGDSPILDPPFLFGHSTLFRKEIFALVGPYHEPLRTNAEDVELSERLLRAKKNIYYQPLAVVEHLKRDTLLSVAKTNWRYYFFGYFYNIDLKSYLTNFKRNGMKRIKEVLVSDFKSHSPILFLVSLAILSYCLFADLKYLANQYGKKRLYD